MLSSISMPMCLRIGGAVCFLLGGAAWIAALSSLGGGSSSVSWAVLGLFPIALGSGLFYIASSIARDEEVERIRALGKRVAATVTKVTERDPNDTGIKAYLHATWQDPETGYIHELESRALPRAVGQSYNIGDPVVVFIDPADPQHNHFEIAEYSSPSS